MTWEDELRRLDEDREAFRDFDEARPLGNDRLSPRQRVDVLLDAGTFLEIGARARGRGPSDGAGRGADRAVPGDGIVAGFGTVAGRAVGVVSEDPLALASTDGEVGKNKVLRVLAHAYQGKLPDCLPRRRSCDSERGVRPPLKAGCSAATRTASWWCPISISSRAKARW